MSYDDGIGTRFARNVQHLSSNIMANFIELSNAQGPRAFNIDHIQTFTSAGQGTRITFRGNGGQEDVRENYEVVRAMLSVTSAPQQPLMDRLGPTEELVTMA